MTQQRRHVLFIYFWTGPAGRVSRFSSIAVICCRVDIHQDESHGWCPLWCPCIHYCAVIYFPYSSTDECIIHCTENGSYSGLERDRHANCERNPTWLCNFWMNWYFSFLLTEFKDLGGKVTCFISLRTISCTLSTVLVSQVVSMSDNPGLVLCLLESIYK